MSKTIVNVKTDIEVKLMAQKIAKDLGLPLSTVVNAYLKEFIRERGVTFSLEPKLRPEIEKLIRQARQDYKTGRNISPVFKTAEEAIKYLRS